VSVLGQEASAAKQEALLLLDHMMQREIAGVGRGSLLAALVVALITGFHVNREHIPEQQRQRLADAFREMAEILSPKGKH
jgi:hypothetical protein